MGSSETTISGPKTCQAILKIRLQKKSTNTKIVGIEIMKPSYLMELFCYFTFFGLPRDLFGPETVVSDDPTLFLV